MSRHVAYLLQDAHLTRLRRIKEDQAALGDDRVEPIPEAERAALRKRAERLVYNDVRWLLELVLGAR